MVIAGPNGVGKSTLLFAIKEGAGVVDEGTKILYQGPHRVLRRTNVQRRWLGGAFRSLAQLLSGADVSGYEGLNFFNPSRTPENVDEAGSTIKHTLGKIENKRQAMLASALDRLKAESRQFDTSALPDIYEPLKQLTEYLLPHLSFSKVDFTNEDDIKIFWERKDAARTILVDIDDLSSGEKAIIVLFLPLLEHQLQERLVKLEHFGIDREDDVIVDEHRVVLIDEPEQHLHPDLQSKILAFMRSVTRSTNTQFIITTHSPSILDQAYDTELYVLSSPTENTDDNQLRQIATNAERLEALKQLAGSTYFLTTGRVVVCIEGEKDADPERPTDARLLEILYPRATSVTLVPTTGKGNVITTVERLREHVPEDAFKIRVRGLVDADQSRGTIAGVETLPVCMIENFLLDSESILTYLQSVGITTFATQGDVERELKSIAQELRNNEIELRVRRRIRGKTVRIGGSSIEEIKQNHQREVEELNSLLPDDASLEAIVNDVTTQVDGLISSSQELLQFRGKNILTTFYQRHVSPNNIGYNPFCIDVAKVVATKNTVAPLLDPIFERLLSA